MKKIKVSLFGLLAIAFGVAGSAFTSGSAHNGQAPLTVRWYEFMGDPTSLTQVKDNTKYQYTSGLPCSGSHAICAVQTTGGTGSGAHPDSFSSTLKTELTTVFDGGGPYADITQEP